MTVSCDGQSCCLHPAELCRYVMRDGVLHSICTECGSEFDADDMPVVDTAVAVPILGTPCGDDVGICQLTQKVDAVRGSRIANEWGGPL